MFSRVSLAEELMPEYRQRQNHRLLINLRVSLIAGVLIALFYLPWSRWHDDTNQLPTIELGLALAVGMLIFLVLTFFWTAPRHVSFVALAACLYALTMATTLLATLPNGFLFGVGTLLSYTVVVTVLSTDLPAPHMLMLAGAYLVIPNTALALTDAPWLIFMNTNWLLFSGGMVAVGLALMMDRSHRHSFLLEHQLAEEKARGDALLSTLLPAGIASQLQENSDSVIADVQPDATVLFADVVGFTELSRSLSPEALIELLTSIFTTLDELAVRHGLEKIKTIGDSYMVAAGVADAQSSQSRHVAEFGLDAIDAVQRYSGKPGLPIQLRVGMSTGPIICGVIGKRKPYFDLWGPTVNLASRLEEHAPIGCIHIDQNSSRSLAGVFSFEERGVMVLDGIGEISTCLLTGRKENEPSVHAAPSHTSVRTGVSSPVQSVSMGMSGSFPHSDMDPS